MRAVIYTGGELFPDRVCERPRADDLVIAADAGLVAARAFGVVPHILLGDFDSLGDPTAAGLPPSVELLRVPAEKDDTDTQLAASVALARGATEILIVGGFGGRPDHTLANLALLEDLFRRGVPAVMVNGASRARFFSGRTTHGDGSPATLSLPRDPRFRYLSLIPADVRVTGVSLSGCKYPLRSATLLRRSAGFATSNEISADAATLSVRRGSLWILECKG